MSRSVLIYGAGALGRGFVAPLMGRLGFGVRFVDVDAALVATLRRQGTYRVAHADHDGYRFEDVAVEAAYCLGEEQGTIADHDLVVSCVGSRAYLGLARRLVRARLVVSCEDVRDAAMKLRTLSGNSRIQLGIADVVASSATPPGLLAWDPLTVVTDEGALVTEHGAGTLPETIGQLDGPALEEQWICKVFLHDAPRAIVACLGGARGAGYVHEAMADPAIDGAAVGALEELVAGVTAAGMVNARLARTRAERELVRLRNRRLYDPIVPGALAVLARGGGLVTAAHLALHAGVRPTHIVRGIRAAIGHAGRNDGDGALSVLRRALGARHILRMVAGVDDHDPLHRMVMEEG